MPTRLEHMAVQMTLNRCGIILMDRSQVRTALSPQHQRGPPHATDCDSRSLIARGGGVGGGGGQCRVTGNSKLRLAHWKQSFGTS